MSEARRGTVMVIQRGDPEITGAIVAGMMAARVEESGRGQDGAERGGDLIRSGRGQDGAEREGDLIRHGFAVPPSPEGKAFGGRRGDPEGKDLEEGGGRLTGEQIEVVEAEIDRQKILADLVRVAVNNGNTPEDYRIMTVKARGDYGRFYRTPGPARRFARLLLGVYGLAVLMIAGAYRAQDRVLEG